MPGHILAAICPCGFSQEVWPGAHTLRQENVIAYAPEGPDLITIDSKKAEKLGLVTLPNPFLEYVHRPMGDPEVQRLGHDPAFECPKCHETTMHFEFKEFWD